MTGRRPPARRGSSGGLRRRLTLAFLLVAAASAGVLAVASYALVREVRLDAWRDVGLAQITADLRLADGITPDAQTLSPSGFVRAYQDSRGTPAVLVFPSHPPVASDPRIRPRIPAVLTEIVASGRLGYDRVTIGGVPYLIVGGRVPDSPGQLYILLSGTLLRTELHQLASALALGWAGVVVLAALVGRTLATQTLEPVARASRAARLIARGQLDTRLPAGARDEFAQWAAAFNEMADALQGKITALSAAQARERRFTSDVAHELRTPLTALVAEASVLADLIDSMPEGARRPTQLLVGDVRRLRTLVDELMELSRLDSGTEAVQAQPVGLTESVRSVLRLRGWDAQVEVARAEDVVVRTDLRRLERIVANLVGNAVEHAGRGVRVTIGQDNGAAFVEVSDQGPGIAAHQLPHIFDRFYKADPARSGAGSGLGLAIALDNALLLGGGISVRTEVGAGSAFRLTLPLVPAVRQP